MKAKLINKYNVPGPRYTSYPTVPYWDKIPPTVDEWTNHVKNTFSATNKKNGISIYIHLPFCESLCTYCGCNTKITVNHAVEIPYILNLLKEWGMYLTMMNEKPKIKEIHLGGGTPTFFKPENLKILIEGIMNKSVVHENAEFSFEAHPKNTSLEHLKTLFALGFKRLSLGIQDFDIKVQETVNRVQPFEMVKEVVDNARKIGYHSINFDLIYGLPFQKQSSVQDTISKVILLKPERIAFYSYAHIPWIKAGQRSFSEKDLPSDSEKHNLYNLGKSLLEKAGYTEIGMDHFALPEDSLFTAMKGKTLHRNFMGYTHNFTQLMIGLGVSSISDSWTCFAQNVKVVNEYNTMIENGKLPIFKGHILTDEDLIIRKHILAIMCNFQTEWNPLAPENAPIIEGVNRMLELQDDGLVILENNKLLVTDLGRATVRNICMALDTRLYRNTPSTRIFSQTI